MFWKRLRRAPILLLALWGVVASDGASALAQTLENLRVPSTANPVGSGARALGMGGAFIAVADDATAASWNPGGLVQLERPEVSAVGGAFWRREHNDFRTNPEAAGPQSLSGADLNYLSASVPFTLLDRNMIVSVNYQVLYDFSRRWRFPLLDRAGATELLQDLSYEQQGSLAALGIAYCIEIVPRLSFGFALNVWTDLFHENGWTQTAAVRAWGEEGGRSFRSASLWADRFSFSGFNANVGLLWVPSARWTLGAVFKTPFTANLGHESRFRAAVHFPDSPQDDTAVAPAPVRTREKLDMPMAYGLGASFRFSDAWFAALDVYRTEWGSYVLTNALGLEISPVTGKPRAASDVCATHQVRLGTEYLFVAQRFAIPVHLGAFYDPAPAEGSPDPFFGVAAGTGAYVGHVAFDVAYQFRFGRGVGRFLFEGRGFSQDVDEHTLYFSVAARL